MKYEHIYIVFFVVIFSCQYTFQLKSDKLLIEKTKNKLYKDEGVIFLNITDFDWDNLIILGPYSSIKDIEDKFNLNLTNIKQNGISYSDHFNLIVFLKNDKSVKIIEIDNVFNPQKTIIKKSKSKFKIDSKGIAILVNK